MDDSLSCRARSGKAGNVLIRNVSILEPDRKNVRGGQDIRIVRGRIEEIGRNLQSPSGTDSISGSGLFALPGLVDLHVHLVWDGGRAPVDTMLKEGMAFAALRGVSNAIASLRRGVTTIRDVGSPNDVAVDIARAFDSGLFPGPTVFPLGRILQPTGGHVPEIGLVANGVQEVTAAVRKLKERGVSGIKMASTGGAYGPEEIGPAVYSFDEMKAIVEEAHRLNLKVSTHALGPEGIRFSVDAGIDTIEHGAGIPSDVLKEMKRKGTVLVPTLAVYRMLAESEGMIPAEYVEKARRVAAWHQDTFRSAIGEGVAIALGTDAGSPNFGPHPSVFRELEAMVECGMDSWEAIAAATCNAAAVLRMERTIGKVEAGFWADILLVEGNPEEDLKALRRPFRIFKRGLAVEPFAEDERFAERR